MLASGTGFRGGHLSRECLLNHRWRRLHFALAVDSRARWDWYRCLRRGWANPSRHLRKARRILRWTLPWERGYGGGPVRHTESWLSKSDGARHTFVMTVGPDDWAAWLQECPGSRVLIKGTASIRRYRCNQGAITD